MDIELNKQKFIHFVFVLNNILCENEGKIDCIYCNIMAGYKRYIRITGVHITGVQLYFQILNCIQNTISFICSLN